jgi:hypothetical protein
MSTLFGPLTPLVLLAMIAGLVQFAKSFEIQGKALTALSLALGVVLAIGYQVAEMYAAMQWFTIVVYGVLFGLTAAGLYDLGKQFTAK